MKKFFPKKIPSVVGVLIGILVLFQTMLPLHRAQAVVPTWDASVLAQTISVVTNTVSIITNTLNTVTQLVSLNTKEYILDPLIRVLVFSTLQSMTDEVMGWITGDEGRGVGFVKNLEQELANEVAARAEEFADHLNGVNLCSINLKQYLQLRLSVPQIGNYRRLNPQLSCKLTGIVDDIENFYNDFNNGGWDAFLNVALIPENNFYGASFIAEQNSLLAQASAASTLSEKARLGAGFKGVQLTKKSEVCETVTDEEGGAELYCYTEQEVTTPGKLISESLNKSLNDTSFDSVLGADELSELIDAFFSDVINALLGQLLSGDLF
ncbi:MAG: hypothetical protein U1A25_03170 [Candidatus Sungbacteria bacterium]|nr:hypothetical protein [bacterium]MDZ4260644.1 hypothetical protein [Candidatus Sungbacteria bacterium]